MSKLKNIADKNSVSLDNVCYLLESKIDTDDEGWQEETFTERECFCAEMPVASAEFYRAGHEGIKLEKVLVIDSENYDNETAVKYDDEVYSIVRIYISSNGFTELHLTLKVGNYGNKN